ncbi:protein EURL homolog isoform X1 [Ciconia boyciana]|uniref:protein EURL homolog isoform X1 n=1 Tax=Ciconia boyciana TaxID=52775 RepID=UPI003BA2F5D9
MNEEQFVSIDLDDDNVCSVCKLGTEKETLSFCHVCFELNIEGVPRSDLLHTRSLRGHRDCFEKFHLIANQDCPRSKLSKSPYAEVKNILSKKINWIIQYAQNKDLDSDPESSKTSQHQLFNFRHQTDRKLLPQFDSPVPRYSAKWIDGNSGGISSCSQTLLEQRESTDFRLGVLEETGATFCCSSVLWSNHNQAQKAEKAEGGSLTSVHRRHPQYSREEYEKSNWRAFLNFRRPEKEDKKAGKIISGKIGNEKEGNNGMLEERVRKGYCKKLVSVSLGSHFFNKVTNLSLQSSVISHSL